MRPLEVPVEQTLRTASDKKFQDTNKVIGIFEEQLAISLGLNKNSSTNQQDPHLKFRLNLHLPPKNVGTLPPEPSGDNTSSVSALHGTKVTCVTLMLGPERSGRGSSPVSFQIQTPNASDSGCLCLNGNERDIFSFGEFGEFGENLVSVYFLTIHILYVLKCIFSL